MNSIIKGEKIASAQIIQRLHSEQLSNDSRPRIDMTFVQVSFKSVSKIVWISEKQYILNQ